MPTEAAGRSPRPAKWSADFFLIDSATREEAVGIAEKCPAVGWATVGVREVAPCHFN